jgi:hypothetical protein
LHAVEGRVCPFHQADLCKREEVAGEQHMHRVLASADGLRRIGCQPFSHESDLALFSILPLSSTFARKKNPEWLSSLPPLKSSVRSAVQRPPDKFALLQIP